MTHVHLWVCDPPNGATIAGYCDCGQTRQFPAQGYEGMNPPKHRVNAALFTKREPHPVGESK